MPPSPLLTLIECAPLNHVLCLRVYLLVPLTKCIWKAPCYLTVKVNKLCYCTLSLNL